MKELLEQSRIVIFLLRLCYIFLLRLCYLVSLSLSRLSVPLLSNSLSPILLLVLLFNLVPKDFVIGHRTSASWHHVCFYFLNNVCCLVAKHLDDRRRGLLGNLAI